jgi:phosphoheptose isomerase
VVEVIVKAFQEGKRVFLNGGSAADAQHQLPNFRDDLY